MDLTKIDKPFGELDRETKIALFTAWVDGAQIELDPRGTICDPMWARTCVYRVAQTKPSIDWSHVDKQFKWLAADEDDKTYLYSCCPQRTTGQWIGDGTGCGLATTFASFRPGNCDWCDSLVRRPE